MKKTEVGILLVALISGVIGRPAKSQTVNDFFDDTRVQQIRLTVDPADWASLQANYLADTYYHATFVWNGITENIGIRSHGGGSRSPVKPNLDLNFSHYTKKQMFLSIDFLIAKANNQDPTNLHEWISMKMFRKMGFPAPREVPAQLYVNGQLLGFYMMVEHLDEFFLARNFGESGGYLYEWQPVGDAYNFETLGTDPTLYSDHLDLKTNQDTPDLQNFANLVQAVNQPSSGSSMAGYLSGLAPFISPSEFLTYVATEQVLAASDGMVGGVVGINNFYLYQFQNQTLYSLIPWDKDFTFSNPNRDIYDGLRNGVNLNLLAEKLVAIPAQNQFYLNMLVKAANVLGGPGGWADSEVTREYNVIRDAALDDPNKQCNIDAVIQSCSPETLVQGVADMHDFLAGRQELVLSEAASSGYQPIPQSPTISRVAAVGDTNALTPGALSLVTGSNLGSAGQGSGDPLPRVINGKFVAVEGVRAPLLQLASGQVEIQIPVDIAPGTASFVAYADGYYSNTLDTEIKNVAPAILALVHANGSAVDTGHPAVVGEDLSIYGVGFGAVNGSLPLGSAAPLNSLVTTQAVPTITFDTTPAHVSFSGLVPGFVGLYQVNFTVPVSRYTGALTLAVEGQSTKANVVVQ